MANCKACEDLKNTSSDFTQNGVTDAICTSLKNDTGFNPAAGHNNCTDIENANECLIENMEDEVEKYRSCDWKKFAKDFAKNVSVVISAINCSMCGLWTNVKDLLARVTNLTTIVNNLFNTVNNMSTTVNNMSSTVNFLTTNVTNLDQTVNNIENRVDAYVPVNIDVYERNVVAVPGVEKTGNLWTAPSKGIVIATCQTSFLDAHDEEYARKGYRRSSLSRNGNLMTVAQAIVTKDASTRNTILSSTRAIVVNAGDTIGYIVTIDSDTNITFNQYIYGLFLADI